MQPGQPPARPGAAQGASALHATIIACRTQDEGACIMCADCGHMFVLPVPLSDESEEADNVALSKALFYHMCALPKREPQRKTTGTRKTNRRRT